MDMPRMMKPSESRLAEALRELMRANMHRVDCRSVGMCDCPARSVVGAAHAQAVKALAEHSCAVLEEHGR